MATRLCLKIPMVAIAAFCCFILLWDGRLQAQIARPVLDGWESTMGDNAQGHLSPSPSEVAPASTSMDSETAALPFYLGEKFRYQNLTVWGRFWVSAVGTSISFLEWDERDWLWFGLTVGGTLAFMAPTDPSPDARLQFWLQERRTEGLDYVFPRLSTERFSVFGMSLIGVSALSGWIGGWPEIVEWSSLMLETLGLTQTHHVIQKLLIGREGPHQGDGLGIVLGPTEGYKIFPSGTPSGHTASVFALTALTMDYFDTLWIDVLGYTIYSYICVSVLYNNQHFISDVVWGAPLGYFIGKWVVRHRSSKYRYIEGEPLRIGNARFVGISPWTDSVTGASGLSATWTW